MDGHLLRGVALYVTLHYQSELLGTGEVTEAAELHRADRHVLSGPFHPTAALAAIWPILLEKQQLVADFPQVLARLPPESSPDTIRTALLADTTVVPALNAVTERIAALALEVRDASGTVMPGIEADIGHWDLLSDLSTASDSRQSYEQEAARQGIVTSGHVLILTRRRAAPSVGQVSL